MAHGGYRAGAGRKPGVPNVKKKLLADIQNKIGFGPVDVMTAAMRHYMGIVEGQYRKEPGERDEKRLEAAFNKAAEFAAMVAPYTNSRKAAVTVADVTPQIGVIRAPAMETDSAT